MTTTQTVTVTKPRASNKVLPTNHKKGSVGGRHTSTRIRSNKVTSSRHNVQKHDHHSSHGIASVKQASADSPNDQARRRSSGGSSSELTGSNGSGGESRHGARFTQSLRPHGTQNFTKKRNSSSDLSYDSNLEKIIQSLPGSFPKSPRRQQKPNITVARPFTDFGVPNQSSTAVLGTIQSSPPSRIRKDSGGQKVLRLSPRSLRRARLLILDRKRNSSLSGFTPQPGDDRRGSILLPRQHHCEPDIRGHHDVSSCQSPITGTHTKQNGNSDPDSPDGGNDPTSSDYDQRRRSIESCFRIANMRVARILHLIAKESYCVEIVQTSSLRKMPLDDVTKASVEEIAKRNNGSTMIGVGPWVDIVSCGEDPIWNNWCYLSRPLTTLESDGGLPAWTNGVLPDEGRGRLPFYNSVILVPLTDAQASLLNRILKKSKSKS